jgi:uncharacterized membrane protein (DUF2068 family)
MQATSENRAAGLRIVAIFEASKGILVILVGLGIFSLVHHSAQNAGEAVVQHLHLNFLREHPRILIYAAAHLDNSHLRILALIALVYATIRFIEAYGLWHMRNWAEWFAIVSGGIYLPFELYELIRHATVVKAIILVVNAGIVAYLVYFRWSRRPRSGLQV